MPNPEHPDPYLLCEMMKCLDGGYLVAMGYRDPRCDVTAEFELDVNPIFEVERLEAT